MRATILRLIVRCAGCVSQRAGIAGHHARQRLLDAGHPISRIVGGHDSHNFDAPGHPLSLNDGVCTALDEVRMVVGIGRAPGERDGILAHVRAAAGRSGGGDSERCEGIFANESAGAVGAVGAVGELGDAFAVTARLVVRLDVDGTRQNRGCRRFGYHRLIAPHICDRISNFAVVKGDFFVLAGVRIFERAFKAWERHHAILINHGAFKQVAINQVAGFHGGDHIHISRAIVGLILGSHGDRDGFRGYGKFLRAGAAQVVIRFGNRGRNGVSARLRWDVGGGPEGRPAAGRAAIGISHRTVAGVAGDGGRVGRVAVGPAVDGDAGADRRLVDRDGLRQRRADILTLGIAWLVPCQDHGRPGILDRDGHRVRTRLCDLEHAGVAAVPVPVTRRGSWIVHGGRQGESAIAVGLASWDAL